MHAMYFADQVLFCANSNSYLFLNLTVTISVTVITITVPQPELRFWLLSFNLLNLVNALICTNLEVRSFNLRYRPLSAPTLSFNSLIYFIGPYLHQSWAFFCPRFRSHDWVTQTQPEPKLESWHIASLTLTLTLQLLLKITLAVNRDHKRDSN